MKHCILVVEDNEMSRELLSDWLDLEGFSVVVAENLKEAMSALIEHKPHAVLLDVQLGAEDGLSLAQWIRNSSEFHDIPVIAVTAHAMVTDQARVLQSGCNVCISKPIDFQILRKQLASSLSDAEIAEI